MSFEDFLKLSFNHFTKIRNLDVYFQSIIIDYFS